MEYSSYIDLQKQKTCDPVRRKKWLNEEWDLKLNGFKQIFNNNTDFIRAITDGTIICEATPIKLGKRSQIWEAKIYNNDNECARSTVRLTNIDKS